MKQASSRRSVALARRSQRSESGAKPRELEVRCWRLTIT
jgi:hypothetical protein